MEAGEASLGRIIEVLRDTPEIQDKPDAKRIDPATIKGRIVFENASFGYRDKSGKPMGSALQNINLTIEPGETVGFLGATGSGKSTLVNLIPRFYDVTEGRITIDGIDVRDIPTEATAQVRGGRAAGIGAVHGYGARQRADGQPQGRRRYDARRPPKPPTPTASSAPSPEDMTRRRPAWRQLLRWAAPAPVHSPRAWPPIPRF